MSNQPFPEGPWSAYNARTFSPAQPEASLIEIGDENQARKETQAQGKERDTNGQRVIQIEKTDDMTLPHSQIAKKHSMSQNDSIMPERGSDSHEGGLDRQQHRYDGYQAGVDGDMRNGPAGGNDTADALIGVGAWVNDSGSGQSEDDASENDEIEL